VEVLRGFDRGRDASKPGSRDPVDRSPPGRRPLQPRRYARRDGIEGGGCHRCGTSSHGRRRWVSTRPSFVALKSRPTDRGDDPERGRSPVRRCRSMALRIDRARVWTTPSFDLTPKLGSGPRRRAGSTVDVSSGSRPRPCLPTSAFSRTTRRPGCPCVQELVEAGADVRVYHPIYKKLWGALPKILRAILGQGVPYGLIGNNHDKLVRSELEAITGGRNCRGTTSDRPRIGPTSGATRTSSREVVRPRRRSSVPSSGSSGRGRSTR
jgi:hypothetical protein